ncbi:MAG: hypothetical protein LBS55_08375 [Prevotellaceae bacterium]|nr:hypothetical protein [Prevotellaceae bacterium]
MQKKRNGKTTKTVSWIRKEIVILIEQDRSPQQITSRMKLEGRPTVSHEMIYRIIRQDREQITLTDNKLKIYSIKSIIDTEKNLIFIHLKKFSKFAEYSCIEI